jgi:hypothetical protein
VHSSAHSALAKGAPVPPAAIDDRSTCPHICPHRDATKARSSFAQVLRFIERGIRGVSRRPVWPGKRGLVAYEECFSDRVDDFGCASRWLSVCILRIWVSSLSNETEVSACNLSVLTLKEDVVLGNALGLRRIIPKTLHTLIFSCGIPEL